MKTSEERKLERLPGIPGYRKPLHTEVLNKILNQQMRGRVGIREIELEFRKDPRKQFVYPAPWGTHEARKKEREREFVALVHPLHAAGIIKVDNLGREPSWLEKMLFARYILHPKELPEDFNWGGWITLKVNPEKMRKALKKYCGE